MTELVFEAPVGLRILRSRFHGVTTWHTNDDQPSLWWSFAERRWINRSVPGSSNYAPCGSYKAFLRHLKKHQEQLKGYEVVLVSRYIGYNVTAFPA